jgi:hypothetical protein
MEIQRIVLLFFMTILVNSVNCAQQCEPLEVTVPTHLGAGFFCEFLKVVNNILHFEDENLVRVSVDWTHEFFPYKDQPHENGWDLYFDPIEITDRAPIRKIGGDPGYHELHDQLCRDTWVLYDQYLPYRLAVQERIQKYIKFKKNILQEVEYFYASNMTGYVMIGVHVRFATAHGQEVPGGWHPALEDYIAEVNMLIQQHTAVPVKVFLATDSHKVINYFKNYYGPNKLVYIDAFRAQGSEDPGLIYENADYWLSHPAHFHQRKPGYFGGKTTLIDGLLLSKCDYLIHTTSNVSTFASFMNPHIKSVYLPKNIGASPCHVKNTPGAAHVKHQWHLNLS